MPTRRSLPKSHHGCNQCKQRRVKCDEKRPKCSNCTKRGVDCVFRDFPTLRFQSSVVVPSSTIQSPVAATPAALPAAAALPPLESPSRRSGVEGANNVAAGWSGEAELWDFTDRSLQDLALFHHYTCTACNSVIDDESLAVIWRETMPREALSYTFLLHGLLALSALHVASTVPQESPRYHAIAIQHHDAGLTKYRHELARADRSNCSALFGFASVATIITFALGRPEMGSRDPIDELLQIAALYRGIPAALELSWEWVASGPLGKLTDLSAPPDDPNLLEPEGHAALDALEARINGLNEHTHANSNNNNNNNNDPSSCSSPSTTPSAGVASGLADEANDTLCSRECYQQMMIGLRESLIRTLGRRRRRVWAMSWLTTMMDPFVDAMRRRDKLAMACLAFYGVMLHYLRDNWWIGPRGALLVDKLAASIGPGWDDVLAWPKRQIRRMDDL